jgi:hypothetical protein
VVAKSRHGVLSRSMRSEACHYTLPEPVTALITWRPRCSEEAAVPLSGQIVVKEAAVSTRGRLLHATTDWRLLCRPISSIPAVRQLSAGKSVSAATLRLARQGGEEGGKLREQRLRAESAKVVRSSALGRRPTRGGESARTRWSCGGSTRPPNLQARRSHGRAHWQKETALWARWGAHRERVGQTRRQRLGVARRSANTHGIARCIPVFWVWGGR